MFNHIHLHNLLIVNRIFNIHMIDYVKQWCLAKGDDFQITKYNQPLSKIKSRRQWRKYFKSHSEDGWKHLSCHCINMLLQRKYTKRSKMEQNFELKIGLRNRSDWHNKRANRGFKRKGRLKFKLEVYNNLWLTTSLYSTYTQTLCARQLTMEPLLQHWISQYIYFQIIC